MSAPPSPSSPVIDAYANVFDGVSLEELRDVDFTGLLKSSPPSPDDASASDATPPVGEFDDPQSPPSSPLPRPLTPPPTPLPL